MTPRQKRFAWIASGLAALVLVAGLLLYALNSNIVFFYTPTQVSQGEAPSGRAFRIGGLVVVCGGTGGRVSHEGLPGGDVG